MTTARAPILPDGLSDRSSVEVCWRIDSATAPELSLVRSFVAHVAERCEPTVDLDATVLCAHELVVNAVVHGRGERRLLLAADGSGMTIAVFDESDDRPTPHRDNFRGLGLVTLLSSGGWHVRPHPEGGKWVVACLPVADGFVNLRGGRRPRS